ncbi:hypothetical protein AMTR_s00029p00062590 [Amborella trichopoda]|uniref:Pentacotripeptide-repeat region of PRORP domain-containing protein n=2 Tax=Amborella trichopoda TaxID=13333 RepID=W1PNX0_AMBTC|nr:hypothetical protein AMTR_s00029p00062590 [Amborella trichopoda]
MRFMFYLRFFHHQRTPVDPPSPSPSIISMHHLFFPDYGKPTHAPATYASLLQACTKTKSLCTGRVLHALLFFNGHQQNTPLQTNLINMYATCGNLLDAQLVFDRLQSKNVRSWNALIRGFIKHGLYREALILHSQMLGSGIEPDNFTFPFVLKACADLGDLQMGKSIHHQIERSNYKGDVYVCNALVAMLAKCGDLIEAQRVFNQMTQKNVVSWTAMIAGYAQGGRAMEALDLLREMGKAGLSPKPVTLACALPACANLEAIWFGKEIHGHAIKTKCDDDLYVASALSDMYAKTHDMTYATKVFDKMPKKSVVSWNGMIAGCNQNGFSNKALDLFRKMVVTFPRKPNWVTLVNLLPSCAKLSALLHGKEIHGFSVKNHIHWDTIVCNALIDMYSKCGSLELARRVFDRMPERDVITWTAMIAGYGMHGNGEKAVHLFSLMHQSGVRPDYVTFVGLLSSCSHAGLVDQGLKLIEIMEHDYGIHSRLEHQSCIVDLLGRAGRLEEAFDYIKRIPVEPGPVVWGALLAACKVHKNVELAERVAKILFELEPKNTGNYSLLSSIYAESGKWKEAAEVRLTMKCRGLKKRPGSSWVGLKGPVAHEFRFGDLSNPMAKDAYEFLDELMVKA